MSKSLGNSRNNSQNKNHFMAEFLSSWRLTWRYLRRDSGALLLLVAAGAFYAFFYPLPYSTEQIRRVPVAVVDGDQSSLSRQLVRFAQVSPGLDVKLVAASQMQAQQALWRREVEGVLIIPPGLARHATQGQAMTLPVLGNGSYLLLNKMVLEGFAKSVGTLSAGIEIAKRQARGASPQQAAEQRAPVHLKIDALFNESEGYASYIVPAVAVIIVQQTLLIGASIMAGSWCQRGRARARWLLRRPSRALAVWLLLALIGMLNGLFFFGFVFWFWDYPRGGDFVLAALVLLPFVLTSSALGIALGAWARQREAVFMLAVATSIPLLFLSGISWPLEAVPLPLQWLASTLPTSAGIQALVAVNQMGASLAEVLPQLSHLWLLSFIWMGVAVWMLKRAAQKS
ncbi:ABC transporter permease [Undibacterium parvum]|uniref:ABC transporter permease n=2 Tax=Undibacterium TaxID=401469 RepID=A0A6M4A2Y4_9BURK|nr:ABC transporter permease [Undibacterium parvum]AZP10691.1 ABC transporter permease [Undibacterium parvum]QJQ05308.1 ABC transporter permease [Undibacterium piscinae]